MKTATGRAQRCGWDFYGHKFHGYRVSYPVMITPLLLVMSHLLSCVEVHVQLLCIVCHISVEQRRILLASV